MSPTFVALMQGDRCGLLFLNSSCLKHKNLQFFSIEEISFVSVLLILKKKIYVVETLCLDIFAFRRVRRKALTT